MVARNFSHQDTPYSSLLQVPDNEQEFLNMDDLKPHQLTELGTRPIMNSSDRLNNLRISANKDLVELSSSHQTPDYGQSNQVYYDLNTQQHTEYEEHWVV